MSKHTVKGFEIEVSKSDGENVSIVRVRKDGNTHDVKRIPGPTASPKDVLDMLPGNSGISQADIEEVIKDIRVGPSLAKTIQQGESEPALVSPREVKGNHILDSQDGSDSIESPIIDVGIEHKDLDTIDTSHRSDEILDTE